MRTTLIAILLLSFGASAQCNLMAGRPSQFQIYLKDQSVYIIPCSQIDSLTFVDQRMVVHKETANDSLCMAGIDSATFHYLGGDPIVLHSPVGGNTYHVGDSIDISWTINRQSGVFHVQLGLSMSASDFAPPVSNEICVPPGTDPSGNCQFYPDNDFIYGGTNNGRFVLTITDPIQGYMSYSPISDSCRVYIADYMAPAAIYAFSDFFSIVP